MVVDGRQADSRGVYLEELAIMMMEFNCDEAINLDGGGSSCMVADNRLLNRPVGRNNQREIMSAIGVFYGNWSMKYLRKLYDWVLGWVEKQLGFKAFAEISFTEASFFQLFQMFC